MITRSRLKKLLKYERRTGLFRWRVSPRHGPAKAGDVAGSDNGRGHWRITIDGERYLAHRLAVFYVTGKWPEGDLDHRDRQRANNRWRNIRPATDSQNQANRKVRSDSTTGIKGVVPHGNRFRARIKVRGKSVSLGVHDTQEEAAAAYIAAATLHFGEYARP